MSSCLLDIQQFQIGNRIRTTGLFRNAVDNYTPIDPSAVYVDVLDPNSVETNYQYGLTPMDIMGRDGVGSYYLDFDLDLLGYWYVRWWSDGLAVGSTERTLRVVPAQTY